MRDIEDYEKAEELYEYIIDLDNDALEVYLMRARNRISLNKYEAAKEDLNTVIKLNPAYRKVIELDEQLKEFLSGKSESCYR